MEENKQKKGECPLCKVSEETIERLRREKEEKPSKEPGSPTKRKSSWKFKVLFLISVFAVVSFIFYQLFLQPFSSLSIKEKNLSQEQSKEENEASILDIFSESFKVGDLAPNFESEDVYGNNITLSDFQGKKPVLLVFWATWCGYCAKELEDLKAFTKEYQNEIEVIAVASGESKETIKNYIEEKDVNFPMVLDENRQIWNKYSVRGTPAHFSISQEGEIVALRPGLAKLEDLETMLKMLR